MVMVDVTRAVIIAGLAAAILTHSAGLVLIYLTAFTTGVGSALRDTAARECCRAWQLWPTVWVCLPVALCRPSWRIARLCLSRESWTGPAGFAGGAWVLGAG